MDERKQFNLKLDREKDRDVLKRLEKEKNRAGYVKGLIRNDIKKSRRIKRP